MPRLTALALLLLAACATPAPQADAFRTAGTPIYSIALFDPARLPGDWVQAAGFTTASCPGGGLRIGADMAVAGRICSGAGVLDATGRLLGTGPGRLRLTGGTGVLAAQDWWVVWVDTDYRTLAIGTPSGQFGFVLNRNGPLPPDRLRAAAEILDFNGYDTSRLVTLR